MKRNISVFLLICIFLTLCSGCVKMPTINDTTNNRYTFLREADKCYLIPSVTVPDSNVSEGNSVVALPEPEFSSVADMKQRIISGDIPEEEMIGLLKTSGYDADTNRLEICDPEKLYDAVIPEGVSCSGIVLHGTEYTYGLKFENGTRGYMSYTTKNSFDYYYKNILYGQDSIFSDEMVADRNARVIHYKNNSGRYKDVIYTLPIKNGELLVEERYHLEYYSAPNANAVSKTVPASIHLYGAYKDAYFYVWITDLESRPAEQWLAGFGLTEYGWTADSKEIVTLPELLRQEEEEKAYDGTDLLFQADCSIELWAPEKTAPIKEGSTADTAIEEKTNVAVDIVAYTEASQYEERIAKMMIPPLTYADELYYGSEFGPQGAYIDWHTYLKEMPNVKAALSDEAGMELVKAYTDDMYCMYQLPIPGMENGSWLVSAMLSKQEKETVLRFVDWLYSDAGQQILKNG